MGCICARWVVGMLCVASALPACFSPSEGAPATSEPDSGTGDEHEAQLDAGLELPGSGGRGGASGGGGGGGAGGFVPDAGVASSPLPEEIPISPMQAVCLAIDQPICASCHVHPNTRSFVLRPKFSPPPPPDLIFDSEDLEACGVFIGDGPDADAGQ